MMGNQLIKSQHHWVILSQPHQKEILNGVKVFLILTTGLNAYTKIKNMKKFDYLLPDPSI